MFESIQNEEPDKKLVKRNLALRFLEINNNTSSILKSTQLVPILNLLCDCFSLKQQFDYEKLSDANQKLVVSLLTNLVTAVLGAFKSEKKPPSEVDSAKYATILSGTLRTLAKLVDNSQRFRQLLYSINPNPISLLFEIAVDAQIRKDDSANHCRIELDEADYKTLIAILVDLSKDIPQNESLWSSKNELLVKLIDKYKQTDLAISWCLFIIQERLNKENYKLQTLFNVLDENYSFEYLESESEEEQIQIRNFGLKYLKFINEPKTAINSDIYMNILYYIASIDIWTFDSITPEDLQNYFVESTVEYLKYLYKDLLHLLLKYEAQKDPDMVIADKKKRTTLTGRIKRTLTLIEKLTTIIQNYANASTSFCIKYHRIEDSIKVLFDFIKNDFLSDFLVGTLTKPTQSHLMLKEAYESVIGSLHNLSRFNYKFNSTWDQCDAVESCIQFSKKLGPIDSHYRFYVYMIIANIASDSQIDTLDEIRVAIEHITLLIKKIADMLDDPSQPVKRTKIQFSEDDEPEEVVFYSSNNNEEWNLIELLEALYHMSVNDNIKMDIYKTYGMREVIKRLIMKGNPIEREFSLRLLYQLCFDDAIVQDVAAQSELAEFIENQSKLLAEADTDSHSHVKRIAKNCDGILWVMQHAVKSESRVSLPSAAEEEPTPLEDLKTPETITKTSSKLGHIMISYNRESRDICLDIKKSLHDMGYNVWIDVDNIRGSSLESMAKAIEDSEVVLMGMTEKYKQSSNCRLEAEYAVNLNKPIVPLIFQKDYKPDGWLGIILGSKMFINFKKYPFTECIERLKKEVETIYQQAAASNNNNKHPNKNPNNNGENKSTPEPSHREPTPNKHDYDSGGGNKSDENETDETVTKSSKEKLLTWCEQDTDKWMRDKSIHAAIVANLSPCNGKILYQMYVMLHSAPEFFYYSLKNDIQSVQLSLKDLAHFSYELTELFK